MLRELHYKDYIMIVFYPVILGLFLFILRGDLMSGITFLTGMFVAFNLAIMLTTNSLNYKVNDSSNEEKK